MNKFISAKILNDRVVFYFLGIKISSKKIASLIRPWQLRKIYREQDAYDLTSLNKAQDIVVFLIPEVEFISGGILSIFSLCAHSRKAYPDAEIILVTYPGKNTYTHNHYFKNSENIYRWEQLIDNARECRRLVLHIPEYMARKFPDALSEKDTAVLKSVDELQINILNQNMEQMPQPEELLGLQRLTSNITQTLAFVKNVQQPLADRYQMPVHLFSTWLDYSKYNATPFEQKDKTIVVSPDGNDYKQQVVAQLRQKLPDYRIVTVENLRFDDYMALISKSFAVITFGEGFDWYFMQPPQLKTLSFSVYNETFFPNDGWLKLENVFPSYPDMEERIADTIQHMENHPQDYLSQVRVTVEKIAEVYSEEKYVDNLCRFYQKKYDLLPQLSKK